MTTHTSISKYLIASLLASLLPFITVSAYTPPHFHSGLCAIEHGEKWGFIDKTGKVAIPFIWDDVESSLYGKGFREGLAAVKRNDKWGFISTSGKAAFPKTWESAKSFHDGMAAVQINGKGGFIDKNGTLLVEAEWDSVGDFSEGLATVRRGSDRGYINKDGSVAIPLLKQTWSFGNSDSFAGGLVVTAERARIDRMDVTRFGYMNNKGEIVIPAEWDEAGRFSDGLAAVKKGGRKDGKWGFIDTTGKVVIPPTLDTSMPGQKNSIFTTWFSNGFAPVVNNGKFGFIDKSGKVSIPCEWDFVLSFNESGLCVVERGGKWGLIDKTGKVVVEPIWGEFGGYPSFSEGLLPVGEDGKLGFIDTTGKLVIPLFDPHRDPKNWFLK